MEYGEYARHEAEWNRQQAEWWTQQAARYKKEIAQETEWIKEARKEQGAASLAVEAGKRRRRSMQAALRRCERQAKKDAEQAEWFRKEAEAWESRK